MNLNTVRQDYDTWLGKFKPRRTSDDCFTPPGVWEAVAGWVEKRYDAGPGAGAGGRAVRRGHRLHRQPHAPHGGASHGNQG